MANEFKVKNGLIVVGDVTTSGTITINGALAATQSWVTSQAYLTSASLSGYATQSYVTSAISALIDAAPSTLDTLNELAAALGDDANFATTITNSLASKLPLTGGTLTGALSAPKIALTTTGNDYYLSLNGLTMTSITTGETIWRNLSSFRFSDVNDWDYNSWAGLKFINSTKQIVLGVAGNVFTANSPQTGTLLLDRISTVYVNNTSQTVWHSGNLTNLNQLSNGPGYITSYTETDTLASVTGRGSSSTVDIQVNGINVGRGPGALPGYNHNISLGVNNYSPSMTQSRAHIAIGYNAFDAATSGYYSIAIGPYALDAALEPSETIAIGIDALGSATYPDSSIAIGPQSLFSDTEGYGNVAIGSRAGNAYNSSFGGYGENTFVGNFAGSNLKNARETTVIGSTALQTSGHTNQSRGNIAVGSGAGYSWNSGYYNTWIGYFTNGFLNGSYNVIIGGNLSTTAIDGAGSMSNSVVIADGAGNIKLFANSSGNVGIGTTSPSSKLQVAGDIRIQNETGLITDYGPLVGRYNTSQVYVGTGGSYSIVKIGRDDGGGLNVLSGGNVGIGTSSPSYKLDVNGTIRTQTGYILGANGLADITIDGNTGSQLRYGTQKILLNSADASIFTANVNRLHINNSGNVGIGTTSPTNKLEVSGSDNTSAIKLSFPSGNTFNTYTGIVFSGESPKAGILFASNAAGFARGSLIFATSNSNDYTGINLTHEKMRITDEGNVGIGTTTPDSKLHIEGTTTGSGSGADAIVHIKQNGGWNGNEPWALYVEGYSYLNGFRINAADGQRGLYTDAAQLGFAVGGNSPISFTQNVSDYRMYIAPGGNVGIGTTSPAYTLVVKQPSNSTATGFQITQEDSASSGMVLQHINSTAIIKNRVTGDLTLGTNDTERLRITAGGNVGIGTTSPTQKLDVAGSISFSQGILDSVSSMMFGMGGASLVGSSPQSGNIKIALPTAAYGCNTMMSMTIQVYEYSTGQSFTLRVGGYNYYNHDWYNVFAILISESGQRRELPVYFGNDGTRDIIWIGNTNFDWYYPNIFVTDFQSGHTAQAAFRTGWNISITQTAPTNVTGSRTAYRQIDTGNYTTWTATAAQGTKADTAYGWGNHATAGYLTSVSDVWVNTTGDTMTGSLAFADNADDVRLYKGSNWLNLRDSWNNIHLRNSISGYGIYSDATIHYWRPHDGSNNYMTLSSNGLGIGTNSPSYKLDVNGSFNTTTSGVSLTYNSGVLYHGNYYQFTSGNNYLLYARASGDLLLGSNDTERIRITSAGNVGIGTTSPLYRLHVAGSTYVNGGTLFLDSGEYLRWGNSNQGIVGANDSHVAIVSGGSTRQTIYADGRTYFPGLDLSISNINSTHGTGNYFRGDASHFVLGTGGTLYLNYGGSSTLLTGSLNVGTALTVNQGIGQNNLVGRPYAVWGAGGTTTGAVVIKFPGNTGNYGMIHAVIDIYEYGGNTVSTVIVGGHNWGSQWYNYGANLVGQTDKQIRVAVVDGAYAIVIGDNSSSWSYGQIVLRKIQNGSYYQNVMNVSEGYTLTQTASLTTSWISGDLRKLTVSGQINASGGNSTQWNTAYGWGNHASVGYATTSYVTTQINNLIAGAPGALDTLDELAAALGDDSNFATTVTNSIATKLPLSGGTMTGQILFQTSALNNGFRWDVNSDAAGITFKNTGDGDANSYFNFFTEDNGNEYFKFSHNTWNIGSFDFMDVKNGVVRTNGDIYVNASQSGSRSAGTNELINGNRVWHAGDFSSTNISNWNTAYSWGNHASAGYLTSYSETDTLASVTSRGNSTTNRINVRGIGNQYGGNIMMGDIGEGTSKWSYLTGTHYNATSQPQGFALIGGLSTSAGNSVIIGGNIYEANAATDIQFWTHTSNTSLYGGSLRMLINSDGNVGIGTSSPAAKLHVYSAASGTTMLVGRAVGGSSIKASSDAEGGYLALDSTGGATIINHYSSDNIWMVTGGGNVGIGTGSPGWRLHVAGESYTSGVVRIGGTNPFYFEDYGGGWYMTDGDWVRTWNSKSVYTNTGRVRSDAGDYGFQNLGSAAWYMLDFGSRSASVGGFGIGLTNDIGNRTLSFHVPNYAAYGNSGAIPKFGWYSNGGVELMTLQSATGNLWIAGALTEASSLKLKENIKESEGNLDKVLNLRPVHYNKIGSQTTELGLIAEEVSEVYPEFVQYDENGDPVGVHYSRLTAALIGAVKELTNQLNEIKQKING